MCQKRVNSDYFVGCKGYFGWYYRHSFGRSSSATSDWFAEVSWKACNAGCTGEASGAANLSFTFW